MLEKHYRDIQDFEFTVQDGKLFMLQTRNGKRTGPAAVRIAVDMVHENLISKEEAVLRVEPQQLDQLLHPVLDPAAKKSLTKLAVGLPASPGAAVGTIVFTADDAVIKSKTSPVVLVRKETVPGRYPRHGSGQGHSHFARRDDQPCGRGLPRHGDAVRGRARKASTSTSTRRQVTVTAGGKAVTLKEGDWLSLDGSTGEVFAGKANTLDADPTSGVMATFMGWADEFRGKFGSAPTPISRATPRPPANSAPRALACAAPSTCSLPRTASRTCRP